jgi:hypothetical protein
MAYDKIKALANVTAAQMTLEHKLRTLEQQRRLRRVFLCRKLVQTPIQILGDTQIHSHSTMVPNQYHQGASCQRVTQADKKHTAAQPRRRAQRVGQVR